jgi:hypothetical protein
MRSPLVLAALLAMAACAAPAQQVETPAGTRTISVLDRVGARVVGVTVERERDGWELSGAIQGAWLKTASRRTVHLEAFDTAGERLSSEKKSARLFVNAPRRIGIDSARFVFAVLDPSKVARYEISLVGE